MTTTIRTSKGDFTVSDRSADPVLTVARRLGGKAYRASNHGQNGRGTYQVEYGYRPSEQTGHGGLVVRGSFIVYP